ncbi:MULTISPECIES: hypothetical protein [Rossellomorea]|uniref:hypothetical protein n=1 Tax=Rossellomorea TaxID=2837508 RepID=UPI001E62324E|nr:hypothetical protein [Rossellomorea arthrocnemi]
MEKEEKMVKYKGRILDLDTIEYDDKTLLFLRKKLDDFTIDIFRLVVNEAKNNNLGLVKTRIEDYSKSRKRYDNSFLMLEAQGFIERKLNGTSTPYYLTERGKQLIALLIEEKRNKQNIDGVSN